MKTIDRYIISELIPPFLLGVFGFVLIMIVDILFTFTDLIINKGIPILAVIRLLIYKFPAIMVLAFPVSVLFAVAMTLTRLSKDNELVALRTSGLSLARLSIPILVASLLVSGLSYVTNEKVVPYTNHVSQNIIRRIILKSPLPEVKEKVFFRDKRNRYFYVHRVNPKTKTLENIMIYELSAGQKLPRVIVAHKAKWEGGAWDLEEGVIHNYDKDGHLSYQGTFSTMRISVQENILAFTEQKTPAEMSSQELKELMGLLEKGGVSTQALAVDWHLKFSIPLTCFVFALIGIPLSIPPIRTGRTWGVILSIVIVFSFYVLASIFRSLGRGGVLSPLLSAWLPQVLVSVLGLGLLVREGYFK